jgi:Mg-chelatase subunit ChlI
VVGLKRKGTEKKTGQRVMGDVEKGSVAPLELSDRVMEQVEVMAKELRKISGRIWAFVEGVRKLMEVVEEMRKKEAKKVDKEMETESVQKVDKQTEMKKKEEDSKEEEECYDFDTKQVLTVK